jgi:hypothetical protein
MTLLVMAERKTIDDRHIIPRKRGNGQIRREVWMDKGIVVRYNLAYINHLVFPGDHGRVVGYDNNHGFHHRHFMGKVETFEFSSMEDVEERFFKDWTSVLPKKGIRK